VAGSLVGHGRPKFESFILTGKPNPYRPGSAVHGDYQREMVDRGLTRSTTLATCVREGIIQPLTDEPPSPVAEVANAATDATMQALWIGIRGIGEQITRLADQNLRR
jgi:hypothetical protein